MSKKQSNKAVKKNENCSFLIASNCPLDKPTKYAGLGFRIFLTSGAWVVLCMSADSIGFFSALLLFYMNLAVDYHKFIPNTKTRQWIKSIGLTFSYILGFIAFVGLLGGIKWDVVNNIQILTISEKMVVLQGISIRLENFLYISLVSVFLTAVDWVVYEGALSIALKEERSGQI